MKLLFSGAWNLLQLSSTDCRALVKVPNYVRMILLIGEASFTSLLLPLRIHNNNDCYIVNLFILVIIKANFIS